MAGIINSLLKPEDDPLKAATTDAKDGATNQTMTTTAAAPAGGYTPEKVELGPNDTVEGRTANIVKSDSPLNTLARTSADQASNRRGIINSTMGVQAGEMAVLNSAKDIATADAQLGLSAKQGNQNAQNQMLSQKLTGDQNIQQIEKQGKVNSELNYENFIYENNIQQLRGTQAKELSEIETQANKLAQTSNSVGLISSQVNASIGEILANQEFTPETKQQLIDMQITAYRNQLAVLGGMNNLNLTALLDFSAAGGSGNPVTNGSGTGGTVTKPPAGSTTTFDSYVNELLKSAGGQPSESLIVAALDEAVTRGESAGNTFAALRKMYPTIGYQQFEQEVANRGYQVSNDKITKAGQVSGGTGSTGGTGGNTPAPGGNQSQSTYAQNNKTFMNHVGSSFPKVGTAPTEQAVLGALAKARELGIASRDLYNALSPYYRDISYEQFQSELANRGYTDLMDIDA